MVLDIKDLLNSYGMLDKPHHVAAQVVRPLSVWFTLADFNGKKEDRAEVSDDADVLAFVKSLKCMYVDSWLAGISPPQMRVFRSKSAFEAVSLRQYKQTRHQTSSSGENVLLTENGELDLSELLNGLETNSENELFVVMPNPAKKHKLSIEAIVGVAEKLEILESEYQLDTLEANTNTFVKAPGLNDLWKSYCDFSSSYYIRNDEVAFWRVFKRHLESAKRKRLVIIGSPSVVFSYVSDLIWH